MTSFDEAWAMMEMRALLHCPRCGHDPISKMAAAANTPHTCKKDLAAARDLALVGFDLAAIDPDGLCRVCRQHPHRTDCALRVKRVQIAALPAGEGSG